MPFVNIVAITKVFSTFTSSYAFLPNERSESYFRELFKFYQIINSVLVVLVTDREIALMSTIKEVFPSSKNFLCIWNINKNILVHIKGTFECSEEVNDSMRSLNVVCKSKTQKKNKDKWERKKSRFYPSTVEIRYVEKTWIQPHKENFIDYWTNSYHHFGTTTTSCVEWAFPDQRDILKFTGDLITVLNSMHIFSMISMFFSKKL
jgi:MULE transposase domain